MGVLFILLVPPVLFTGEVRGYGPWRLGMTRAEVEAMTAHGPYTPVRATGGLETENAEFRGRKILTSFVFGSEGLYHIQLWPYFGDDRSKALEALYEAYQHLSETWGPLHADGRRIASGLTASELLELVPAWAKTDPGESRLDRLPEGTIQMQVERFHLHPVSPPAGLLVYGSLLHNPQLGLYWVFVYYKCPAAGTCDSTDEAQQ